MSHFRFIDRNVDVSKILKQVQDNPDEKIIPKVKAGNPLHKMLPPLNEDEIQSNMID